MPNARTGSAARQAPARRQFDRPQFDARQLQRDCAAAADPIAPLRAICAQAQAGFDTDFERGRDCARLVRLRAAFFDQLLTCIWDQFDWRDCDISLAAVGGYGRGELHPRSDIDLLILVGAESGDYSSRVEQFLTRLWDIKLDIGHSVRTPAQCRESASADITVVTTLMESRLIRGSAALSAHMQAAISSDRIWPSDEFFRAKWDEQRRRHSKYADTEYNLEPNVKGSPGGLRDIQTIGWIALRHFGTNDPGALREPGFLTADELDILRAGRDFLWRVRYALHLLTGRKEDRLLFEHQRELARLFGYRDSAGRPAVEQFMQQYYRRALALGRLNELLMQHFDQAILHAAATAQIRRINARFQIRNGYIEVCDPAVLRQTPSALLEIFLLCGHDDAIRGVRAATIRLIRENLDLIDDAFRQDPHNQQLFMEILRAPCKLARQLRRMNRYGVLGAYLPEFGKIIGQMQHDLFHIYTVDAHTLEVIKNMRRFLLPGQAERFPVASRVARRLPQPELLYIAGLYHDIGKGRGGDHSELSAIDARAFCRRHGLSADDTGLVCWLVENHLLMSGVAQRKDISDPDIIGQFAANVGDTTRLDYLLCLTVADICATNPTLWNAWRGTLLRQLYSVTRQALRRGLHNPLDKRELIEQTRRRAMAQLTERGFSRAAVETLWAASGEDYFLREQVGDIVWHTESIAHHLDNKAPLVLIKPGKLPRGAAAMQIFIHVSARDYLFAVSAAALEQLELSVHAARLYKAANGMSLYTFYVLDNYVSNSAGASDPDASAAARSRQIVDYLSELLQDPARYPDIVQRRTPRQIRYFSTPTATTMSIDSARQVSVLEVVTPDRPGLLARLGRIFFDFGISLQAAKIATLGERVEDVFFITDARQQPIADTALCERIQAAICAQLDEQAEC